MSLANKEPVLRWSLPRIFRSRQTLPRDIVHKENPSKTALRACSSSGLEKVSSLRLVFLLSSDDPGPWDPEDPVTVEPSLCPSGFQELAEPEPLEAEATFVSKVVTQAARLSTICSMFVIFASYEATVWESVWESVWAQFSNLCTLCASRGTFAIFMNISLMFISRQPKLVQNSEKTRIVRPRRMPTIPTSRRPLVTVPIC